MQRRPLLVKTVTSAALFGLGDFMSQKLEKKQELDLQRIGRMVAWGGMFAPLAHVWYGALDKMIPGQSALIVAQKVVADQVRETKMCARSRARRHAGPRLRLRPWP